jgi:hypothetical protein
MQVWHGTRLAPLRYFLISGYPRTGRWEVDCKSFMPP